MRKDRIALMGKNQLEIHPSENHGRPAQTEPGQCIGAEDTVIAYLPQHLMTKTDSPYTKKLRGFCPSFRNGERIDDLNRQLTERTDYDSPNIIN